MIRSRQLGLGLGLAAAAIALALPGVACAATITPTIHGDEYNQTGGAGDTGCSLREAIQVANTNNAAFEPSCVVSGPLGDDTIQISGHYGLSVAGADEDSDATGDLDVNAQAGNALTIAGAPGSSIDATGLGDRVLDLLPGSTLNLEGVEVENGSAPGSEEGGGIRMATVAALNLSDGSSVVDSSARTGGGVEISAGTLNMTGGRILGNTASAPAAAGDIGGGGLAAIAGGAANLTGVLVDGNTISGASGDTAEGGGLYAIGSGTTINLRNSALIGNTAEATGTGNAQGGGLMLENSGAVPTANLVNVTVSDNTESAAGASSAGGIENSDGHLTLANVTVAGNHATTGAVGLATPAGTTTVKNSIFDEGGTGECANAATTLISAGHNIDRGASCGFVAAEGGTPTSREGADPMLSPLDNDGDGIDEIMALATGSPAIDFVPAASCTDLEHPTPAAVSTDQRGYARPYPAGGACDAGAYEQTFCNGLLQTGPSPLCVPPAGPGAGTIHAPSATAKCKKKKKKRARSASAAKKKPKCKKKKKKK